MRTYDEILTDLHHIGKRTQQHDIVSAIAFLIGIREEALQEGDPHLKCYKKLSYDKNARIIRNLCRARTTIWKNFKELENRSKAGTGLYSSNDILPTTVLSELETDGASFIKRNSTKPYEHIMEINRLINERINNCRGIFPLWLNWDYIRGLFVVEDGTTYDGALAAAKTYYSNSKFYPYGMYINWEPDDFGNMIYNDLTFLIILYGLHGEKFTEYDKVSDIKQEDKNTIYDFIDRNEKIVMVVDCENSDPYRLSAVLKGLDEEQIKKMRKIYLFDDIHTTPSWEKLHLYTNVEIEHKLIERLHAGKSMVDMTLALTASKEYHDGNADAFIIASSDSDYWTLMQFLPDADFLVLVERSKCGEDLKMAMEEKDIFYCFMDDFYSGNTDMQRVMINQSIRELLTQRLDMNLKTEYENILHKTRIQMSETEKAQNYKKLVKSLNVSVDDDGTLKFEAGI